MIIEKLDQNIRVNSGWQKRDYLGLSKVTLKACKRQMYYEAFEEYSVEPEVPGHYKCREGYLLEREMKEQLQEAGFSLSHEDAEFLPIPGFDKIRFHIEGFIKTDRGWELLEIKHRNNHKFEKFQNRIPWHICQQVQGYLHFLRPPIFHIEINSALLIIKNIDTAEQLEFTVGYNPAIGSELEAVLHKMKKLIEAKQIPDRDYLPDSQECKYCIYKKICW